MCVSSQSLNCFVSPSSALFLYRRLKWVSATLVSNYAQNEQNFNAVERILYYTELPSEGDTTTPTDPPPSWPEDGAIEFKDVEMSYRPGLPAVLKGVSFQINPGEKVRVDPALRHRRHSIR